MQINYFYTTQCNKRNAMICIQLKIKYKIILLKTLENWLNKSYFMTYQDPIGIMYQGIGEHVNLESPEMILFLKYEDLKNETAHGVKKIAEFIGYPFSLEEEDKSAVQKIINLCSFQNMLSLEVNKSGITQRWWQNTAHFLEKVQLEIGRIILHRKWQPNLIK